MFIRDQLITRLYAEVVRVADPEVASVPPWAVVRNCEVLTPWFAVRYLRNKLISPLKLVMEAPLEGRKEKTWFDPFEPEYRFQVCPAREMLLATGFGVPSEL